MILDRDVLRLAEKMSVAGNEAEWRCADSRAYYPAFTTLTICYRHWALRFRVGNRLMLSCESDCNAAGTQHLDWLAPT